MIKEYGATAETWAAWLAFAERAKEALKTWATAQAFFDSLRVDSTLNRAGGYSSSSLRVAWVFPWASVDRMSSEYGGSTISLSVATSDGDARDLASVSIF